MSDQIEIRLFGRLWIRQGNGSVVQASQWATGKTTDLLRLLALRADQMVSTASLTDKLWPEVTPAKAAASLHTATAQIRKVLGKDSITRHLSGLQLQGCWVDAVAHRGLSLEISNAMRSREFARVITAAKHAEALYVDDFHAHDDESDWAGDIRDELRNRRKLMLVDAAESAIKLGWMRDAIEMSTLAVGLDSFFEPAHRALMRAYAGIGETDSAARSYERCRRNLTNELGASPSPQTEALHLRLTSQPPELSSFSTYVGRERAVTELAEAIRDSARGDGDTVICLTGMPGSGREAMLQAATDRVPRTHLRPAGKATNQPSALAARPAGPIDVVVIGPADQSPTRALTSIAKAQAVVHPRQGRVRVVITTPETAALLVGDDRLPHISHVVESTPLEEDDLTHLAHTILAGQPSTDLVATLRTRSEGLAGAAVGILRTWVSTGQVISSVRGLALVSDSLTSTVLPSASAAFRVLAERLEPVDMEICQVMAVLDRPSTAAQVMEGLVGERRTESRRLEVEARLDHLSTRGIFTPSGDTYAFRDRTTLELFELWLRPSLQSRIEERIDGKSQAVPVAVGGSERG
ncbi:hypothetical protein GCM10022234_11740 [Aeromicrobium panaciterrae]|uniref:BTAD domain-containing putative transcriptional regulator n=1 Tax=Aeromicrobium panaciterrae TaxID=363861 RepID=UPI0031D96BE5